VAVRNPRLWGLFRAGMRRQFDTLAPSWDAMRLEGYLASHERALDAVEGTPRRILDLGTGTGAAAFVAAKRFPEAEVVGVDLSEQMLAEARGKTPPELAGRVRFERADGSRLPYPDASFDLVTLANMIPFFDELARVTAPGGTVAIAFSSGAETPIYVPLERVQAELQRRNFSHVTTFSAGPGQSLLARKDDET
jgi:ubiquinone/menaquinone biosynthesis C-methylase UbiE